MPDRDQAARPPDVHTAMRFIRVDRQRRCDAIQVATCTACGWSAPVPSAGDTLDLFGGPEHTATDCRRRQLDPDGAHLEHHAWLNPGAALQPPGTPRGVRQRRGRALPVSAKSVARPTDFGNPFRCDDTWLSHELAVTRHRRWLNGAYPEVRSPGPRRLTGPEVKHAAVETLVGWDLACYCELDQPCHRDTYLELLHHTLHRDSVTR